jgi:poly(A) polymerase
MTSEARQPFDAAWLREGPLPNVLAILNGGGEEARVVGGAVRNALLGQPHGEIDIATTALPDEVMRRAQRARLKTIPTGIEHGTVTVVAEGVPFEVTTLRQDVETFGRKANVRFGRDWRADAERRDFTMNALSVSADGVLHDYVGGLADLNARRVRFIGEPERRIREDYLRILRFFRFHASYGEGAPDAAGLHAAIVLRDGLEQLSRERIRMEILKLLVAPGAAATLAVMADCGILSQIFAGVPIIAHLARLAAIETTVELPADAVRRLGALALLVEEDAERLTARLRLSNEERDRLASMVTQWWRVTSDETRARRLLYALGPPRYADRVLYAWSRSPDHASEPEWLQVLGLPERWPVPRFQLRAADFLSRGIAQGPELGRALKRAEAAWIEEGFPADQPSLARIADAAAAS